MQEILIPRYEADSFWEPVTAVNGAAYYDARIVVQIFDFADQAKIHNFAVFGECLGDGLGKLSG